MIFPISHEKTTVRTLPWASAILFLALVSSFLLTPRGPLLSEASERLEAILAFVQEHPHLELDPRVTAATGRGFSSSWVPEDTPVEMLQAELDRRTEAWLSALERNPYHRWGLVPRSPRPRSFFSYLFVHGSWLHLGLNLLWLYLCAPFVEDRWGAGPFLAYFFAVGALAGGTFVLRDPGALVPLIGSSGAVAGVIAAFLLLHGRTKMDFIFWLPVFGGTFSAPAWLMIPVWFGFDFWAAAVQSGARGGGTAYWAHVGGFLAGLVISLTVRAIGLSTAARRRGPRRRGPLGPVPGSGPGGGPEEPFRSLLRTVRDNPGDQVSRDTLWGLARETGRQRQAAAAVLSGVREALRLGNGSEALGRWRSLFQALPDVPVDPVLAVELAAAALRLQRPAEARELLTKALGSWREDLPFPVLDRALHLAGTSRSPQRRAFLDLALGHPEADPRRRQELEAEAAQGRF